MDENVIIARFSKSRFCRTEAQFRYNRGQKLRFQGDIELPATYQVHFSNSINGQAKTVIGNSEGVSVPQEYFIPGENIYAWIFIDGDGYGITKYQVSIPISPKAIVVDQQPDPDQATVIDEAIEALNNAVENVQNEINSALQEAKDSGEFDGVSGSTIWTYLTTPIAPNFTFYIYLLKGTPDAVPKVNDIIICGGKMYNITEVHQFDVLASYYADIKGKDGIDGDNGVGVPAGGLTNDILIKNSPDDYDTIWYQASLIDFFEGDYATGAIVDSLTPRNFGFADVARSIRNNRIPAIKCYMSRSEPTDYLIFFWSGYNYEYSGTIVIQDQEVELYTVTITFSCEQGGKTYILTLINDHQTIVNNHIMFREYWQCGYSEYFAKNKFDGSLSMENAKITNLADGTNNTDAVNFRQLSSTLEHFVLQDDEGSIDMDGKIIYNLGDASAPEDAVNLGQVMDLISTNTAFFRGNYLTNSSLLMHPWQTINPEGSYYVTNNDYAIVQNDETHSGECWRYVYVTGSGWEAQYRINETPLSLNQLAALNSGITAALVTAFGNKYDKPQSGIPKTDLAADVLPIMLTADVPYNSPFATINASPIAIKTAAESGTPILCRVRVNTQIDSEYKYRYLNFVAGDRESADSGYPNMRFTGTDGNATVCELDYVTAAGQSRWIYSETKLATKASIGDLTNLTTTEKSSIVGAINEVNAGTIFLAEYGTTPFADIYAANQNGIIVALVDRNNDTFKGWLLGIDSTHALFSCVSETYVEDVTVTSADVWDDSEITYFATTEDLDAISEFIGEPEDLTTTDKSTLIGAINEVNSGLGNKLNKTGNAYRSLSIPYGVCDGTSTATDFTATVDGITELRDGICVWLKNGVIASASGCTLNINNLGAKPIYKSVAASTAITTEFGVNYTMLFVYDSTRVNGGCWVMVYGYDSNTTYTPVKLGFGYGTCSTAEATIAKTVSLSSYTLTTNGIVSIKFTNAVPAGATLNINSKGAKAIYYKGAAIAAGVIKAGDTATFIYSTNYHLISIDRNADTLTASDVGAVASDQGIANAGKFLLVGSDGIVTPVTMSAWQGGSY